MSFHPTDGMLFQEQGRPEIYLIRDGERLHIPNPYVMDALSLDWNAVQTVQAGMLDLIPRDLSWEALGTQTPGSTVFVPTRVGWFGLAGQVYWPLPLDTTKRHVAWGQEVRTIELRGWINPPGTANTADPDFSYELEIDVGWVLGRGIDVSALLRVGNILGIGIPDPGSRDPRAWCARPVIKMEISGLPPKGQRDRTPPPDWTRTIPGVVLDDKSAGAANGQIVKWPFDPVSPPPGNTPIQGGEYVRVFGSIVTDKAHPPDVTDQGHSPEENLAMRDAVLGWRTGTGNNEDDQARWTEVHPPDWIEILGPSGPATQSLRGIAVIAPGTYPWRGPIESVLDVDIMPPQKPRPDAIFRYREIVGPETTDGTIVEGNADKTGALITPLTSADGIHVHVKVVGARSFSGGSPGKFRALYWLYWEGEDMAGQSEWRFCRKCQGMFFGGAKDNNGNELLGVCPSGGTHDKGTSADYNQVTDPNDGGQHNWRFCRLCFGLFYAGFATTGWCPAPGAGGHDGTNSFDYSVHYGGRAPNEQGNWRWCNRCQGLFFAGNPTSGSCPAGGGHDWTNSQDYSVVMG